MYQRFCNYGCRTSRDSSAGQAEHSLSGNTKALGRPETSRPPQLKKGLKEGVACSSTSLETWRTKPKGDRQARHAQGSVRQRDSKISPHSLSDPPADPLKPSEPLSVPLHLPVVAGVAGRIPLAVALALAVGAVVVAVRPDEDQSELEEEVVIGIVTGIVVAQSSLRKLGWAVEAVLVRDLVARTVGMEGSSEVGTGSVLLRGVRRV
jgi:hypothetical protein